MSGKLAGVAATTALALGLGAGSAAAQVPLPPLLPAPDQSPPDQGAPQPPPSQPGPSPKKKRAHSKARPKPRLRRLSNERTRSRWAYVMASTWARGRPRAHARRIKRLRPYTPDGTPEVVLLLNDYRRRDGKVWVRVRLPMRPSGRTGWIPRSRLGAYRLTLLSLTIDRGRKRATLHRRGKAIWRAPVGVGRPNWPTPPGHFYIRSRLLPLDTSGIYGVFAFGTSAYSAVLTDWPRGGMVGIHGTNEPGLIPGRISHGCVRVRNGSIARLRDVMGLGTPVQIR
jgi:lipoprotein-anchoring transpeptidase ErfK/SrfK